MLPALAWALSLNRQAINWRTVGGAFALQAVLGGLVLYLPIGKSALERLASGVDNVLGYSRDGIEFMFGPAVDDGFGFVFAFRVLPVIVFFSALSFSGTARLSTCSHVDERPRIRVCICDFVAFM